MSVRLADLPAEARNRVRKLLPARPAAPARAARRRAERTLLEDSLHRQIYFAGLPMPDRQLKFAAERGWTFDFAWWYADLAVEVEGGTWTGGRHVRPQGFEGDCEKYNEAALQGWTVLRVTGAMVEDGRALALIERAFDRRTGSQ